MANRNMKKGGILRKKDVGLLLSKAPESLNKYIKKHPDFPKGWKDGKCMQARIYFLEEEVLAWLEKKFGSEEV
ncbi:MAG: hypothetical protein Q8L72_10385 [Moraxellaceae bacterium]|nr:hypothetical protein [Moraxellaceae bacterium]